MRRICALLLLLSACSGERPSADTSKVGAQPADSALPMVIDTRYPPVLGIALREHVLEKRWCLHTSRTDIRPNELVKVVFAGGRKFVTATVGAPKATCLRSDTIANVRSYALNVDDVPVAYSWFGVVVRSDVNGTLDEKHGIFAARLDGDTIMDYIQDCGGARGHHLFVTSGDTLGPVRWHYVYREPQYQDNPQPTCNGRFGEPLPDTTDYTADSQTDPPGVMIFAGSTNADSLAPDTRWFALRPGTQGWELVGTTVHYVPDLDACGQDSTGRAAKVAFEGEWLLALARIPGLTAGPVMTGVIVDTSSGPAAADTITRGFADSTRIDFAGTRYRLRSRGIGKDGFQLLLTGNDTTVTVFSSRSLSDGFWVVTWAGDLDRDGQLDLLLAATRDDSFYTWQLHLSTYGKGSQRWLPVARSTDSGCSE